MLSLLLLPRSQLATQPSCRAGALRTPSRSVQPVWEFPSASGGVHRQGERRRP